MDFKHCYRGRGVFRLRDHLKSSNPVYSSSDAEVYSAAQVRDVLIDDIVYFALSVIWRAAVVDWLPAAGRYEAISLRGRLCNIVPDRTYCDFYYPAVVRRGPLQIAIRLLATVGRSRAGWVNPDPPSTTIRSLPTAPHIVAQACQPENARENVPPLGPSTEIEQARALLAASC